MDISYYNRVTNWKAVKDSGIEFVMIRVGYRGYGTGVLVLDDQFENNIKGAKAAGLKQGAYFFSQALNEAEAREEAAFMLKYLSKYSLDFPVAYDMKILT
ncbi:MAG: GH25 family lysozyme [Hydrogeniiclostridium mannosilyticum]